MTDQDKEQALTEYHYAKRAWLYNTNKGTRYALAMARAECQLLGFDPDKEPWPLEKKEKETKP